MSFRVSALLLSATILVAACSDRPSVTGPVAAPPTAAGLAINPAAACDGTTVPVVECEALVALYNSTNGPGWTNDDGWGTDPNPCSWQGIECTGGDHGSISSIRLIFHELTGSIPSELGNLPGLVRLVLTNNNLTGSIPSSLGNLVSLDTLELFDNDLTGAIPASLGNLPNLRKLSLSNNQLSGSIPAALGNLPSIVSIWLGHNNLTGSIPASLGNMSTLTWLILDRNQLSGSIPEALGNMTSLQNLSLTDNQISGSIPASFANLDALHTLSLGQNALSGPVPNALMQMASLEILHLEVNQLSGILPLELAAYLDALLWCQLDPDNSDLIIPDMQAYRDADQDGDGKICFKALSPAEDIGEDAIDEIEELVPTVLNEGQANALQTKIDNAMEKAAKGQYGAAINQMQAFLGQLNDMVAAGTLTPAQAAPFIVQAQALVAIWTAEL